MTPGRQTPAVRRPTLRDVAAPGGCLDVDGIPGVQREGSGGRRPPPRGCAPPRATSAYAGPDPLATSLRQGRSARWRSWSRGRFATPSTTPSPWRCSTGSRRSSTPPAARCCSSPSRSRTPSGRWPSSRPRRSTPRCSRCAATGDNPVVEHLLARGIPLVGGGAPVHPRVAHVLTDEAAAMRLTTRHVLGLGHTRVAHLSMPLRPGSPTGWVTERDVATASYPDAAAGSAGSAPSPARHAPVVQARDLTVEAGAAAARLLLDVPATGGRRPWSPRPTSSRPGWCAPPRRWGCGCRRTSASPASTGSGSAVARPRARHGRPARCRQGAGHRPARAAGPRRRPDRRRALPGAAAGGDDHVVPTRCHGLRCGAGSAAARAVGAS